MTLFLRVIVIAAQSQFVPQTHEVKQQSVSHKNGPKCYSSLCRTTVGRNAIALCCTTVGRNATTVLCRITVGRNAIALYSTTVGQIATEVCVAQHWAEKLPQSVSHKNKPARYCCVPHNSGPKYYSTASHNSGPNCYSKYDVQCERQRGGYPVHVYIEL